MADKYSKHLLSHTSELSSRIISKDQNQKKLKEEPENRLSVLEAMKRSRVWFLKLHSHAGQDRK
jgi:hypothetical protein